MHMFTLLLLLHTAPQGREGGKGGKVPIPLCARDFPQCCFSRWVYFTLC